MNSDVSYEVSYDRKCETKNDKKLNRNSELKTSEADRPTVHCNCLRF